MLAEMDGVELRDWKAWYALKAEERADHALDQKSKAKMRSLQRSR